MNCANMECKTPGSPVRKLQASLSTVIPLCERCLSALIKDSLLRPYLERLRLQKLRGK